MSGIAKQYGFQTVYGFYKTFATAQTAYTDYRDKVDKREERYGEKAQRKEESVHKRLRNYQRENVDRQTKQSSKNMGRGER